MIRNRILLTTLSQCSLEMNLRVAIKKLQKYDERKSEQNFYNNDNVSCNEYVDSSCAAERYSFDEVPL